MPFHRAGSRADLLVPKLLFAIGWGTFWLSAAAGERFPIVYLISGPVVMVIATILLLRRTRRRGGALKQP